MNDIDKTIFKRESELIKKRHDNKEITQIEFFRWSYDNREKILDCADAKGKLLFKATLPLLKWAASQ